MTFQGQLSQFMQQTVPVFSCVLCSQTFDAKYKLHRHYATHGEKPHQCKQCGRRFMLPEYLKQHIKVVHNKTKDFQCFDCERYFSTKQCLQMHQKRFGHFTKHPQTGSSTQGSFDSGPNNLSAQYAAAGKSSSQGPMAGCVTQGQMYGQNFQQQGSNFNYGPQQCGPMTAGPPIHQSYGAPGTSANQIQGYGGAGGGAFPVSATRLSGTGALAGDMFSTQVTRENNPGTSGMTSSGHQVKLEQNVMAADNQNLEMLNLPESQDQWM